MPSASSPVREALESYVAGRVKAERLVIAVAAAYYGGERRRGAEEGLEPLIDLIDRASPGIVELGTAPGGTGFAITLAERPFPKQFEADLRRAAETYLGRVEVGTTAEEGEAPRSGLVSRMLAAVRRLFTASA